MTHPARRRTNPPPISIVSQTPKAWAVAMVRTVGRLLFVVLAAEISGTQAQGGGPLQDALLRDLIQTVQARKELAEDPALASLNLGVEVKGGIATLWGPVPNVELAFRAEARLKVLFELIDVRNLLEIAPEHFEMGPRPLEKLRPERLPDHVPPPLQEAPRRPLGVPVRPDEQETRLARHFPSLSKSRSFAP